jgi:hypothetical protein
MKRLIWIVVTRLAIACAGYMNLDRNHPAGMLCEDCSDYGKWKRCDNCVYQGAGEKKNNWRAE